MNQVHLIHLKKIFTYIADAGSWIVTWNLQAEMLQVKTRKLEFGSCQMQDGISIVKNARWNLYIPFILEQACCSCFPLVELRINKQKPLSSLTHNTGKIN